MTNPFSSYNIINATRIVKSNVRPTYIKEDVNDLLNALKPLKHLSDPSEGISLERNLVAKLDAKVGILDLLIYFGYVRNNFGEYVYQLSKTDHEKKRRENGVKEFQKFFADIRSAQNGALKDFDEFIENSNSSDDSESDEESLPNDREINNGNRETFELIKSFKKSLVTEFDAPLSHNFIRRKLALLSFKQKYPESVNVDDDSIDQTIYHNALSLKARDTQTNVPRTDNVYIECLIRADFEEKEAFEILRHNRPNLELSTAPEVPKTTTKISIDNLVQPLKQHCHLLKQYNNENKFVRQFLRESDKWENTKHIITAIQQIRQKKNNTNTDGTFSKMYRLLYSELSSMIGRQAVVKIEIFTSVLCESPVESIQNLDVNTIKNILCSSDDSQIHDGFRTHASNFLSQMCPICLESFPRNQMESMLLCDHICCLPCLKDYYRHNIDHIQDVQSVMILTCFCERHEITNETHLNFFTCLQVKLNQWFPDEPELLRKYHEKVFNATHGKQIKRCGSLKCISSFYVDENIHVACFRCPYCTFAQCGQCCQKWHQEHAGLECSAYTEWLFEHDPDDPDVQAIKYLSANGITCPNKDCQLIYEYKAGGCEHFTCDSCKTEFCRMCSALFYSPKKILKCPVPNCALKNMLHAHCSPNCFRETRIGTIDAIMKLLNDHHVNVKEGLEQKPVSTDKKCPVEDCGKPTSTTSGDRLCEICYQQFLCSLIWNHQLKPWEIYEDNNLQQMLLKASVVIPAKATRQQLIELCQQHLNPSLGKPKKITRPRV